MKKLLNKANSITRITVVFMMLTLSCLFAGCSGTTQNTMASEAETSGDSFEMAYFDPFDYVDLGAYKGIEIVEDGLDLLVGEVSVSLPYRDESFGTEWTLRYYYSLTDPDEDKASWVIPADDDVARLGIPEIHSFSELKDYVLQKVNDNDEITSFVLIGDAFMDQVIANSSFKEIPDGVTMACEVVYTDYLESMLACYNDIGEIPAIPNGGNSAYKVLAAMAIAKENGIGMDAFDYEEVLSSLVGLSVIN